MRIGGFFLFIVFLFVFFRGESDRTLALTLSNDGGLTMEKQIRKTSVCG